MAFTHGKNAAFSLDNSGGSLTDIKGYVDAPDFQYAADTAEVSVLGNTHKAYVAGLKGATINLNGPWDPTLDAIMVAALGAEKSFAYGPAGSGNGSVKYSGECICTSYNVSASTGGAATWTASLLVTGNVTVETW
jgi:L-aminopeptidase/D-esterase-like protein